MLRRYGGLGRRPISTCPPSADVRDGFVLRVPPSTVPSGHSMNILLETVGCTLNVQVLRGVGLIVYLLFIELAEVSGSGSVWVKYLLVLVKYLF